MKVLYSAFRKLILVGVCGAGALSAEATTYYVKKGGDDTAAGTSFETAFETLQTGLAKLTASAGNTLIVGAGEFTNSQKLTLKAGSVILGQGTGQTTVTFTGSESKFCFTASSAAAPTIIRGLTLTSDSTHTINILDVNNAAYVYLENLVVEGVRATSSSVGAVKFYSGNGRLLGVVIRNCQGGKVAGGLYFTGATGCLVANCLFYDNTLATDAATSGANFYWADGSGTLYNSIFGRSSMTLAPSCHQADANTRIFESCIFYSKNSSASVERNCLDWSAADFAAKCVDYENGDYTITAAATDAIDHGLTVPSITNDLAGVRRPIRECSDIGCYEFDNSETAWGQFSGTFVDVGETASGHCYMMTSDGTLTLSKSGRISRYLIVGGGGGGGGGYGGGGGGGAVVTNEDEGISFASGDRISVTIGAGGGASVDSKQASTNGFPSSLTIGTLTLTAPGGGAGASSYLNKDYLKVVPGDDGANGGGGASGNYKTGDAPGGSPTVSNGHSGGKSLHLASLDSQSPGGGGGGMGGPGGDSWKSDAKSNPYHCGSGGIGITNDITGVALEYAAGGGGGGAKGQWYGAPGGETGGDGVGYGLASNATSPGMEHRGGGGGGGGYNNSSVLQMGGGGGSGVVIIVLSDAAKKGLILRFQ